MDGKPIHFDGSAQYDNALNSDSIEMNRLH